MPMGVVPKTAVPMAPVRCGSICPASISCRRLPLWNGSSLARSPSVREVPEDVAGGVAWIPRDARMSAGLLVRTRRQ